MGSEEKTAVEKKEHSNIFEAQSKANMERVKRLSDLITEKRALAANGRRQTLPPGSQEVVSGVGDGDCTLATVVNIVSGHPGTNLQVDDYLFISKVTIQKRLICKSVRTSNNQLANKTLISIPLDWTDYNVHVLKSSVPIVSSTDDLRLGDRHDWTRPLNSDFVPLQTEEAIKFVGRVYNNDMASKIAMRGLAGRDYIIPINSKGKFLLLRHPKPILLKNAVAMFSLPLHFTVHLPQSKMPASPQIQLKNQKSDYTFKVVDYFSGEDNDSCKDIGVADILQESLHATSFLSLEYVHCHKVDPVTWKRIGEEIILPNFAIDDTRVVEIDKHQVSGHHIDTLSYDCLIEKASSESILNLLCPQESVIHIVQNNIYLHEEVESEHKLSTKEWKIIKIDEHTQI